MLHRKVRLTISRKYIVFPILLFILSIKILFDVFIGKEREKFEFINDASVIVAILALIVSLVSIVVYFLKKKDKKHFLN